MDFGLESLPWVSLCNFVHKRDAVAMVMPYVDLLDVLKAYLMAKNRDKNDESPGIGDEQVAENIKAYVIEHKDKLAPALASDTNEMMSADAWEFVKRRINGCFGDLTLKNSAMPSLCLDQTLFGSRNINAEGLDQISVERSIFSFAARF